MTIAVLGGERYSPAQIAVILILRRGPQRMNRLVRRLIRLGISSRSTAYAAIRELERRGLIEVSEERYCRLTRAGERVVESLAARLDKEIERVAGYLALLVESLGGEEAEGLEEGWRRVPIE